MLTESYHDHEADALPQAMSRPCEWCERQFSRREADQRFCGKACSAAYMRSKRRGRQRRVQLGEAFTCNKCGSECVANKWIVSNGKSHCVPCIREHKRIHPGRHTERNAAWRKSKPWKTQEYSRRWREKNKHKIRAHYLLGKAVKNGLLVREPCVECAFTPAQAHHSDYSKPLDVVWLCVKCHMKRHRKAA